MGWLEGVHKRVHKHMSKRLQVKYLKFDSRGQYRYRRRVPVGLVKILGKREFVKVLGRTETEALQAYSAYHDYVESLISGTSAPRTVTDPKEIKGAIYSLFSEYGLEAALEAAE